MCEAESNGGFLNVMGKSHHDAKMSVLPESELSEFKKKESLFQIYTITAETQSKRQLCIHNVDAREVSVSKSGKTATQTSLTFVCVVSLNSVAFHSFSINQCVLLKSGNSVRRQTETADVA